MLFNSLNFHPVSILAEILSLKTNITYCCSQQNVRNILTEKLLSLSCTITSKRVSTTTCRVGIPGTAVLYGDSYQHTTLKTHL